MWKIVIKYYNLATTSESKLKTVEERENKLKEEMATHRKSCNAWLVEKEKILSQEHSQAIMLCPS